MKAKPFTIGSHVFPGLIKVCEEAAEFLVEAAKLQGSRNWARDGWPQPHRLQALREEANDLQATLDFLFETNPELRDPERQAEKLAKFHRWHEEQA